MSTFSAYLSHKWSAQHLPVNTMLWRQISKRCSLLIDQPAPTSEAERPYFISRLEFMMRHADLMVCCLPSLPTPSEKAKNATGDYRYNTCSPYILFEWRLAERIDLPRFILFDRNTRFQRPPYAPPHVRYVERNFTELNALISAGKQDDLLIAELDSWLQWVSANRVSAPWTIPQRTASLIAPGSGYPDCVDILGDALDNGGFDRPQALTSLFQTDSELYAGLRSIGLLVVDISRPEFLPLYHAAHSVMVPTIRLAPAEYNGAHDLLPPLLRGHPAGYQEDLVPLGDETSLGKLLPRVTDRARAAVRAVCPIVGVDAGVALLHRRTYPEAPHLVFISHNEKPGDRELVEALVRELKARGIDVWEYAVENRAGEDWKINMNTALASTTVMVALVSPRYEKSDGCLEEWNHALNHGIPLLPFLTRGRSESTIAQRNVPISHESRLDQFSIPQQAVIIADRIANALRNPQGVAKIPV